MKNRNAFLLTSFLVFFMFSHGLYAAPGPAEYEQLRQAGERFFTNSHIVKVNGKDTEIQACATCHGKSSARLKPVTTVNYDAALAHLQKLQRDRFPIAPGSPITFELIPPTVLPALAAFLSKGP